MDADVRRVDVTITVEVRVGTACHVGETGTGQAGLQQAEIHSIHIPISIQIRRHHPCRPAPIPFNPGLFGDRSKSPIQIIIEQLIGPLAPRQHHTILTRGARGNETASWLSRRGGERLPFSPPSLPIMNVGW